MTRHEVEELINDIGRLADQMGVSFRPVPERVEKFVTK